MGLWLTHGSPNLDQKTKPYSYQQKRKKICKIVDFAVPADHRIKLKECEKLDKYLDLAREFKKLWNIKVTIVPIVIRTFAQKLKDYKSAWRAWKLANEWRPSKRQYFWRWLEYWEVSWRLEETCAVTQTPVKYHQLTLMGKNLKD